jgi:hypothetical protein
MREKLRGIPVIVVYVPGRKKLLSHKDQAMKVREFAAVVEARFIDGSEPFRGLDDKGVRECYFPVDGHWNQSGSDRFARFIADQLKDHKLSHAPAFHKNANLLNTRQNGGMSKNK